MEGPCGQLEVARGAWQAAGSRQQAVGSRLSSVCLCVYCVSCGRPPDVSMIAAPTVMTPQKKADDERMVTCCL